MSIIFNDRKSHRSWLARVPLLILWMATNGCAAPNSPLDPPPEATGPLLPAQEVTYWPIALEAPEGRVEVYQPQPEAMTGDTITARAAVSLTRADTTAPTFGAAWFTAHVVTDRDARTVTIRDVTVTNVRLPGSTDAQQQDFARAIGERLSTTAATFPLDQLTTSLDTARREQIEAHQIETTPPLIVFSTTPATLVSVNGPPRLHPVDAQPGVSRVANTPFILLFDNASRRYYLKAGPRWMSAAELSGAWAETADVSPAIAAAGAQLEPPTTQPSASAGGTASGGSVTRALSPGAPAPATAPMAAAPTAAELAPAAVEAAIIVATDPTELIVTTGNPQFTPVPGGAGGTLLYASNTAADLFLDQTDRRYYVLLSGRWYAAGSFQGPWQYVASDRLPPAFEQIPADSPKADVLPFVAGTTEAREAILDAGIPQTANIRRDAGAALSVAYDGNPQFQDVPESPGVAYALNSPEDVLRVNGRYYCCHQGVWYESAAPVGPWVVCTSVPQAIYTLPPSCPDYHVRYAYVYDYYPDYVTCGYLPGYTGTYVYGPTIVYGTGYTYPGWDGTAYFPPPCTWGFGAYYDPFAFCWGFDVGLYWGGAGWFGDLRHERWWRDHPDERLGAHRWWGPGGFVHSPEIRGHLMARSPGWNNLYVRGGNVARNVPAERIRSFTPAHVASGLRDNVFAGSDGRVFRRANSGWEERRSAGGWSGVGRIPDAYPTYRAPAQSHAWNGFARPEAGLEQHYAARSRGAFRSAPARSFGGGGGFHGGGGRR
jgi:hypothetical protein